MIRWWPFLVLAVAAWRVARLIGWDSITEPWRRRVLGKDDVSYWRWFEFRRLAIADDFDPYDARQRQRWARMEFDRANEQDREETPVEEPPRGKAREKILDGIHCPFCLSVWVGAAWWLAWLLAPEATLDAAAPVALVGAAGIIGAKLDS